jgi:hypothetical protein
LCLDNGGFKRLANKNNFLQVLLHPTYHASTNCLQSCRSNYHMCKKTSMFPVYIFKSGILWVAYQKLQQIWHVNMQVSNSHMEKHEFVGMFITYPSTIAQVWTSSREVQKQLWFCPPASKVIGMDGSSGYIPDAVSMIKYVLPAPSTFQPFL